METGRRKSCGACARAKRRCELGRPKCRRCVTRDIECAYPEPSSSSAGGAARPSEECRRSSNHSSADLRAVAEMHSPYMNSTWFEFYNEPFNLPTLPDGGLFGFNTMGNIPSHQTFGGIEQVDRTSDVQVRSEFVSKQFANIPKSFVEQGHTSFIHRSLFQVSPDPALQDALSAAALYAFRNESNRALAIRNLEHKARHLVHTTNPQTASRSCLLAATQALLVYQLIRLFDGDIRLRAQAEDDEPYLTLWTTQLRSSLRQVSPIGSDSDEAYTSACIDAGWQSWLLEESIRRTVIVALMLKGIYGFLKTGRDTAQDLSLSFSAQASLWNAQSQQRWSAIRAEMTGLEVRVTNWTEDIGNARPDDLEELGVQIMTMLWGMDMTAQWLAKRHLLTRYGFDSG